MAMRYIPLSFLILLSSFCKSDGQLTHANPLTQGDTLISKSGDFALGFFSPTSTNKSFYLGIWYHNLPGPRTVVWVANQDNPITNLSSPMLAISNSSDLVLSDSHGHDIWVMKSNIMVGAAIAHATLLNSGNFVLGSPEYMDIWQSFDHPTDTILPTMRFLLSYKAQVVGRLIAWKGPDDPSSGDFSCSGDPSCPDTRPYYRISVWNGVPVSGGTYPTNTSSTIYQMATNSGDEFYFMYTISDDSPFTRVTLDYTGKLKCLSWNNHSSSWVLIGERPLASCDLYASCGPFSYCDFTRTIPACQCLDGFEPLSGSFSEGCHRKQLLECGKQSQFIALSNILNSGYMSPEYAMGGAFSVKSDTYSFGGLLLEIVSGLKISSSHLITNFSGLIAYAWRLWEEGKVIELVDSSVVASFPLNEVLRCIHVGRFCVQDRASDRPLMSSVMFMLENETALLPAPKQPVYFALSNSGDGEGSGSMENSMNAISITTLEGR